jgi:UDP-N-acetylglucosamine 2-epimerase (non-hydrolysing)/GDP/UDP-N,N'-diacetylbacillosamine 2-epimerase (hydrolysing)
MDEEEWRVHMTGAPSLDHLRRNRLFSRAEVETRVGIRLEDDVTLVSYHPVTITRDTTEEAATLFAALHSLPGQILFCYPNADAGSRVLIERTHTFVASHKNAHVFVNLDALTYWSLMRQVDVFVGNSSSGIMETPSFALPTINVGLRQQGRERARNIIDAPAECKAIVEAIDRARSADFRNSLREMTNPYGDGTASQKILKVLASVALNQDLLMKQHPELSPVILPAAASGAK